MQLVQRDKVLFPLGSVSILHLVCIQRISKSVPMPLQQDNICVLLPGRLPSRFDLSCFSSLPLICTNDLAEIRNHFYKGSLSFSDSQVGERPPAKLSTTKWLWTGGLGGSLCTHTITSPPPSPLYCFLSTLSLSHPRLFSVYLLSVFACLLHLSLFTVHFPFLSFPPCPLSPS